MKLSHMDVPRAISTVFVFFREGVVVQGCAYGGRCTGKAYRFWMAAATLEVFLELQILPSGDRSHCEACKVGILHS